MVKYEGLSMYTYIYGLTLMTIEKEMSFAQISAFLRWKPIIAIIFQPVLEHSQNMRIGF